MKHYRAPWWLGASSPCGGNLQTLWPALFSRAYTGSLPQYRRERWTAPDADFIDVDWLVDSPAPPLSPEAAPQTRPLLVLFHGLEGSSASGYALAFADWARSHGWAYAVPHFRGCSGEPNHAPRTYHLGDHEEIAWILNRFAQEHRGPLFAVGVSLGGNALLRWVQESGDAAGLTVRAAAAVCPPLDAHAAGMALSNGFNLQVYTRMFLKSMKPKALLKLKRHPGLFDLRALYAARNLYDYDNVVTAPLHGFRNTDDYWTRSSAKPHLNRIRIPTLVLNPRNDPFIPHHCLPTADSVGQHVTLWQPATGGHVAFPAGAFPRGNVLSLPRAVGSWLAEHL